MEWQSRGPLYGLGKKVSQNWESTKWERTAGRTPWRSQSKLSKGTIETFLGQFKDRCEPSEQVALLI
ncbi:hypothetical protein I79_016523 [Cricetulus griseus]|uniref:Uncharacterized protein n=1 Tax=Cricetulus griseus TaxID=10029 RepID=G3HZL6_CRIGR|nr:hypothetical protein I79_016523 [Cricetulus griseus]